MTAPVIGRQARLTRQQLEETAQRLKVRRRLQAAAEADARMRVLGHIVLIAFVLLGVGMAEQAMRVDQQQQLQLDAEVGR